MGFKSVKNVTVHVTPQVGSPDSCTTLEDMFILTPSLKIKASLSGAAPWTTDNRECVLDHVKCFHSQPRDRQRSKVSITKLDKQFCEVSTIKCCLENVDSVISSLSYSTLYKSEFQTSR